MRGRALQSTNPAATSSPRPAGGSSPRAHRPHRRSVRLHADRGRPASADRGAGAVRGPGRALRAGRPRLRRRRGPARRDTPRRPRAARPRRPPPRPPPRYRLPAMCRQRAPADAPPHRRMARPRRLPAGAHFTVEPTAGRLILEARNGRPAGGERRLRTVSHRSVRGERKPLLRLTGQWLADHGFAIGQHFEVDVTEGRLTIEAVKA